MNAAADIVSRVLISEVFVALGGDPPRHRRARAFWRGGDGLSVSLDDSKSLWFDHRDNIGGGVLDLIQHVRSETRQEALHWLAHQFGLPLDEVEWGPQQKADYARRRRDAELAARPLARLALWWYEGRVQELNEAKAAAIDLDSGSIDVDALAAAAKELYHVEQLTPDDVLREYISYKEAHPVECSGLIMAGSIWDRACRAVVSAVIDKIAADQGNHDAA